MNSPAGLRRFVQGSAGPSPGAGGAAAPAAPAGVSPDAAGPPLPSRAGRAQPSPAAGEESCDMCSAAIPAGHSHVADLERSSLLCACRACYLLFTRHDAGGGRYRAVPDRYLSDPPRPVSAAEWDALEIPVGLAFFLRMSEQDQVAGFYPSPAGVTECRLDLEAWQRIAEAHPLLAQIEPDVEAALIHRTEDGVEHYLVPIDACYELAGRMRLLWRGFDGGTEARQSIDDFLSDVRRRARPLRKEP